MTRFIETTQGSFINVDHISEVARDPLREGVYVLNDIKGNQMGLVHEGDLKNLMHEVLPNTQDAELLYAWPKADGSGWGVDRQRIIGWRRLGFYEWEPLFVSMGHMFDMGDAPLAVSIGGAVHQYALDEGYVETFDSEQAWLESLNQENAA